jgi:MGT family glycosyltransferase
MTSIVFVSVPADGHTRRLLPVVAAVAARGVAAYVCTERRFEAEVLEAGGVFIDMLGKYPMAEADSESIPMAMRSVAYAAHFGEAITAEIAALDPALIVYDTFAVIGRVMAGRLGIPSVNVCAGHNVDPARYQQVLATDPRVVVGAACLRALPVLRDRYGMADASPFCYLASISPHLNLYPEPPEYLKPEERQVFEPVGFFGSLPSIASMESRAASTQRRWFQDGAPGPRIYVSFGTVVWRYYATQAVAALDAISTAIATLPGARAVISLGTSEPDGALLTRLTRPNVAVHGFVDQWSILREADVFVTHHGLNSTHEAVYHRVPMLSYPFFWDQPSLAAKCQEFDCAVPLAAGPRDPISVDDVLRALGEVDRRRDVLRRGLEAARQYESAVIGQRDAVIDRLLSLAGRAPIPTRAPGAAPRYRPA